jgi:hypothetical protein
MSLTRSPAKLEQLRQQTPEHALAGLLYRDRELWNWCIDPAYRQYHLDAERLQREEAAARRRPKPTASISPAAQPKRAGITQGQAVAISRTVRDWVKSEFASAERVGDAFNQILELQMRLAQLEKRIAGSEIRLNEQKRYIGNVERKLKGEPPERQPHLGSVA